MYKRIRLAEVLVILTVVVLSGAAAYSQSPPDAELSPGSCRADVEATYFEAKKLVISWRPELAAPKLEALRADSTYGSLSYGCKIKILTLLVDCYEELQYVEQRGTIVQQLMGEILSFDRDFDFTAIFEGESDLAMAENMRDSLSDPEPRRRQLFSFQVKFDPAKTQKIKAGETTSLEIHTVPQSVPVILKLAEEALEVQLVQQDSVTSILRFTADSTQVETARKIEIVGETVDTTRTLSLTFEIRPGGKSNLWKYIAGAVAVGVGAALLLGGDDTPVVDTLNSPPYPPASN